MIGSQWRAGNPWGVQDCTWAAGRQGFPWRSLAGIFNGCSRARGRNFLPERRVAEDRKADVKLDLIDGMFDVWVALGNAAGAWSRSRPEFLRFFFVKKDRSGIFAALAGGRWSCDEEAQ